jgi:hypothetical protein
VLYDLDVRMHGVPKNKTRFQYRAPARWGQCRRDYRCERGVDEKTVRVPSPPQTELLEYTAVIPYDEAPDHKDVSRLFPVNCLSQDRPHNMISHAVGHHSSLMSAYFSMIRFFS